MSIEYLPVGVACNLKCSYCYQEPQREAGNINSPIEWDAARKTLEKHNYNFTVFGGEPLLTPIAHLEEVFKFGYERFGKNGIQTNGTLITPAHIDLFKKYGVQVGISFDGWEELNEARILGSVEATLAATRKTAGNIDALIAAGIIPSLIVTLHSKNARRERLQSLLDWFAVLEEKGIQHINLHNLEIEKGMADVTLTEDETIKAFLDIYEWSKTRKMNFEPFTDIVKLLTVPNPQVSCVWNHCDPATTAAVQGVNPDGTESNCGRVNKDGINWVKGDKPGFERYLLLHSTPQKHGGCQDCKFFLFCKGQCPGTAIDGDWRNRTVDCALWYTLFATIERDIIISKRVPITRDAAYMESLQRKLFSQWRASRRSGNSHGDSPHGDSEHVDNHTNLAHLDVHGDSELKSQGGIPVICL